MQRLVASLVLILLSQPHVLDLVNVGAFRHFEDAQPALPLADAGSDQILSKNHPSGAVATFIGTGSYDPDGDRLSYYWYGPFAAGSGPTLSVLAPEGRCTVSLMVDDGLSLSAVDEAIVTVNPCFAITPRAKPGEVQLTWTHLPGTQRYDIYRAHESNPSSLLKIGETTSTYSTYLDKTVSNDNTYLYVVGAHAQDRWCYSNTAGSRPAASRTIVNHPPVIYSVPISTGTAGITYNYDVQAVDPNADVLSYRLIGSPSGMTIDPPSGLIRWISATAGSFR